MYLFERFGEDIWLRVGENSTSGTMSDGVRVQKWNELQNEGLCEGNKILIQSLLAGECCFKNVSGNKKPKNYIYISLFI